MVQSLAMRERAHDSLAFGRLNRLAMLALAASLAWGTTTPARADTEACLDAYDGNQRLRRAGELRAARAQLLVCSQTACPDPIRKECMRWLAEVDAAMPSVVFAAQDASGHDLGAVRVEVDGVVVLEKLDGRAIALDPGERTVRWTSTSGSTVERRVVIREAQKRRLIEVQFAPEPTVDAASPASSASSASSNAKVQSSPAERDDHREVPTEAWVFGGIGAAGLASFVFFGWRAWRRPTIFMKGVRRIAIRRMSMVRRPKRSWRTYPWGWPWWARRARRTSCCAVRMKGRRRSTAGWRQLWVLDGWACRARSEQDNACVPQDGGLG